MSRPPIANCGLRIGTRFASVSFFAFASFAQDSAAPDQSPTALILPSPSVQETTPLASPSATGTPEPSPGAIASPAPTPAPKNIRITFLPPPLEGTISLGIYDQAKKLVRVLHQEADLDEFVIGDDALSTKWDGRDDNGAPVPSRKYQARGLVVGKLKNEPVTATQAAPPSWENPPRVMFKLVANPLANDERPTIEIGVACNSEDCYLKTADGLPLYTVGPRGNAQRAMIVKSGDRSAEVWEDSGSSVQQFRISRLDQMMAFDCGEIEVK